MPTLTPTRRSPVRVSKTQRALRERVRELLDTPIEYVEHPRFATDGEAFLAEVEADAVAHPGKLERGGGTGLPGHLRALCARPLLSPQEERALFLRMNYERFRAETTLRAMNEEQPDRAALRKIEAALRRSEELRNRIVLANVRLIVSIARKFVSPQLSFDDLLSAGYLPLMRAVELFDVYRGNRFSTYATWAVRNHFLRTRGRVQTRLTRFRTGEEETLDEFEDDSFTEDAPANEADLALLAELLGELDDRERLIVAARFGLDGHPGGQTYADIGEAVGLSKERVRQLTIKAIERIQECVTADGRTLA